MSVKAPVLSQPLQLPVSEATLSEINEYLSALSPEEILQWALTHLPGLHQTTAFGLTGLVAIDMLSKLTPNPPPLIFLDTLYHFQETYDLVEEVKVRYGREVSVWKPEGCEDVKGFEAKWGEKFWEKDDLAYDLAVKIEPARRAYAALNVQSVITGRRASQGGARSSLKPLEIDSTGLFKLNPLFQWPFDFVEWYIKFNDVPRNKLLDQGYKSVGDWHSTDKAGEGGGERDGRWKGTEKTECGLHVDIIQVKKIVDEKTSVKVTTVFTDLNGIV